MASQWFSCKGACSGSDPVSDVVKVDFSKLTQDKENQQPAQVQNKPDKMQKEQEELRRQRTEEAELLRKQEADERRQTEEQAKRRRQKEEEEEAKRQAAAEKAAAERAAAGAAELAATAAAEAAAAARAREEELRCEAERVAAEKAHQERGIAEAQKREEERLAYEKVNAWCKTNGFADMSSKKKSFMGASKYALHQAVAKSNEEMVALMVQLQVDKGLKNSKGQTARDLAINMNKGGSMDGIIAKLA